MAAHHQPELSFADTGSGYEHWQDQLSAHRLELERKFGLPIGVKVKLTLRDFEHPFTGIIELVVGTSEDNPRLRLRDQRFDFSLDEIRSVQRLL